MNRKLIQILNSGYLFLSLFAANLNANAMQLSDSAQLSLLTCSPSDMVYALYGHTALRIKDEINQIDIIFNYGIFDFSESDFIYRFAKGETDYNLGCQNFSSFLYEYAQRKSGVTEQILNLTVEEKQRIFDALIINAKPENRTYRYSFFDDNCSTRPRILIEKNISGTVEYPEILKPTTFRAIVHHCNRNHSWLIFGIDLALGAPLNDSINQDKQMFLPENLMKVFSSAKIKQIDGTYKNLVSKTLELVPPDIENSETTKKIFDFTPLMAARIFLVLVLIISVFEFKSKSKKYFYGLDFCIFLLYGLTGCVLAFLSFFSEHPAVFPNYSMIWANPLHTVVAVILLFKPQGKTVAGYMKIYSIILTLLIISWTVFSQYFNPAFLPLALTLCLRTLFYTLRNRILINR
ncbi:MAG: DUF4105 domain-containing protein [Prevotellaceae bacterium]|nr:DUF4105 domain-containing protein [Prevotellaceae bacterium]